ncbi:MAG: hypothetical protein ACLSGK_02340 [Lachnospiraceae bacterium]
MQLISTAWISDEYEMGTSHEFTNLPIGAYVIRAFDTKGTYDLMVANTYR